MEPTEEAREHIRRLLPKGWAALLLSPEEMKDLRGVLDRAMNTWEPEKQPPWVARLSDNVDKFLAPSASVRAKREAP